MIEMKLVRQARKVEPHSDLLLIMGDGSTLPGDLDRFLGWCIPHDSMCIGRSIKKYPFHVNHYVDVDADAGKWVIENLTRNHPDKGDPVKHTLGDVQWFDACWDSDDLDIPAEDVRWHGSTALFGVLIAMAMGYKVIVLAGCPMDQSGHWYYGPECSGPNWQYTDIVAWLEFVKWPSAWTVKSLSGHTKTILGEPSRDWITWALSVQSNRLKSTMNAGGRTRASTTPTA